METNNYTRFLERILLYLKNNKNLFNATSSFSHGEHGGLNIDLTFINPDNKETIGVYKHSNCSRRTNISEIESFNELVDRVCHFIKIKEFDKRYVTICPNCMTIIKSNSKINNICTNCITKISNIDLLGLSFQKHSGKCFVYLIIDKDTRRLKIGQSHNPISRLKTLQTGSSTKLLLVSYFPGGKKVEKELHKSFSKIRISGEWFDYSDEILSTFEKMTKIMLPKKYRDKFKIT
ncbi:MAG: GIY-YIG nuclease family protein [PVC group bacterium]|nr:GIY-YIG nuclease family protein [PVC group bacterium]